MNNDSYPPPPSTLTSSRPLDIRAVDSQSLNLLRLTAITLFTALLVACGGGGSGGSTNTPSVALEPLPNRLVANTDQTRNRVGGTAPPSLSSTEIGRTIASIAGNADTLLFDVDGATSATCNDAMCTYILNGVVFPVTIDEYSTQNFGDEEGATGYNQNNEAVMTDRGFTIGQRRVAGRITDGGIVNVKYQMYGGWNDDNHFGIERAVSKGGSDPGTEIRTYSFGEGSGSSPTTETLINYTGVMIGTDTRTEQVVHGDATIQFVVSNANLLETVIFQNIVNLSSGADVDIINFNNIDLNSDGTFGSASGDIKGTFYGTGHEGIGGIFDKDNILGAFGAVQQ
ncbi:MAG: hypothetical protein OXE98_09970 [Hyphomicrobiales bacterium]|nr:hypothetical protein [Hyphomicrobiales bacterium]